MSALYPIHRTDQLQLGLALDNDSEFWMTLDDCADTFDCLDLCQFDAVHVVALDHRLLTRMPCVPFWPSLKQEFVSGFNTGWEVCAIRVHSALGNRHCRRNSPLAVV